MEITKARKGSEEYQLDWCDYIISTLVKEKRDLIKAYNYFNGKRDHYQYENIEKNFGVGNPTSVGFTPLTRKHIEALIGEYMSRAPKPEISCKDSRTLTNINRDKQLYTQQRIKDWLSQYLNNQVYTALITKGEGQSQESRRIQDSFIEQEIKQVTDAANRSFLSNYEIAAKDICKYTLNSREIDFKNKLETLGLNLFISGETYFKVVPTATKTNYRVEVCDPLNTWVDKDPKHKYMRNAYKAVVRKWMTVEEIEMKYGNYLSQENLKTLHSWQNLQENNSDFILITGTEARCGGNPGIHDGVGVHPLNDDTFTYRELIPVYETEWIDSYKEKGKWSGRHYAVTRIGQDIYILDDNNIEMPRQMDEPDIPRLNINGLWYTNGSGSPYSLMLATADLQDRYDLTIYLKDNAMALAGTKGAIIDMASIPAILGDSPEERLIKLQGWRKVGLQLIDTAQEGQSNINTIYNGFDDSLDVNTVQAYQLQLNMIEDIVSSITGVFRERLGGIEARDAVANVEVGMQQSYLITKRYYNALDTLVKEMLTDCIDMAKIVYKDGMTGQIILGDQREIFTLMPEFYTSTSYDIHLADSADIIKQKEQLKAMAASYMQSNMMDPEILLIITKSDSITEMYELAMQSIRAKKIENNQLVQLQQQLEAAQQQQAQLQKQLEQSTKKIAQLNELELNLKRQENQMQQELGFYKVETDKALRERELDLMEKRGKIEAMQVLDLNPNNDEVNYKRI